MSESPANPSPDRPGPRTTPHLLQRVCHRIGYSVDTRIRSRDDEAGFTLVEVVVSFVLFAVVAGAAATGLLRSIQASSTTEQRSDAANVAQTFIASTRANSQNAKNGVSTVAAAVGKNQFSVSRTIAFDHSATTCSSGATFVVDVVVYPIAHNVVSSAALARSDARVLC